MARTGFSWRLKPSLGQELSICASSAIPIARFALGHKSHSVILANQGISLMGLCVPTLAQPFNTLTLMTFSTKNVVLATRHVSIATECFQHNALSALKEWMEMAL